MTKKEFKAAMGRGLGRCVTAVKQQPEKHWEAVLWACCRDIAYDAQCEGTRAWYVYAMASSYPDQEPFVRAAAEALGKYRSNGSWDLLHLSELLMHFAADGNETAKAALEEKYRELLAGMRSRKRRPNRIFHELSDLEQLSLVLAVDSKSFLRIAEDLGSLYRDKRYLLDGDFPWFFEARGQRYRKTMERAAKKNESIACFLRREQASIAEEVNRQPTPPEKRRGILLSRWLAKEADEATVERYAQAYREETQPQLRAEALKAFGWCPYPGDPLPVIEDTRSDCEELQNAAWLALENLRHPAVRSFALANAAQGIHTPENFALLVTNYLPEDETLLETLLAERIASGDPDDIHAAGMDILRAFRKGSGIPHPKHLLPLLYEQDPCSCCREKVVRNLSAHKMLTPQLLEECRNDSNEDIRQYAAKRLK